MPGRTLVVDSNVLLLLFVGLFDKTRIPVFKNTAKFTEDDFDLLVETLSRFDAIAVTPHILAEVSNLAGQMGEPLRSQLFEVLKQEFALVSESHVAATSAVSQDGFVKLGLTDAAIATLAQTDRFAVLTADLDLWVHLLSAGVEATNFHHLRNIA